jgi:heme A synthase
MKRLYGVAVLATVAIIGVRGARDPAKSLAAFFIDICLACLLTVLVVKMRWTGTFMGSNKLANLAPPAALLQIVLGAAYRQEIWGILPHIGGAMILAIILLTVCVRSMESGAPHVKRSAVHVMTQLLTQIALGIATFVMKLLDFDTNVWFTVISTAHIIVGATILPATVLFSRIEGKRLSG